MVNLNLFSAHSRRNANLSRKANGYLPPRVLAMTDIILEENLLVGSVSQTMLILTEGQESVGFFEGGDIATTDNPWLD
jgi:hypothetical protein